MDQSWWVVPDRTRERQRERPVRDGTTLPLSQPIIDAPLTVAESVPGGLMVGRGLVSVVQAVDGPERVVRPSVECVIVSPVWPVLILPPAAFQVSEAWIVRAGENRSALHAQAMRVFRHDDEDQADELALDRTDAIDPEQLLESMRRLQDHRDSVRSRPSIGPRAFLAHSSTAHHLAARSVALD